MTGNVQYQTIPCKLTAKLKPWTWACVEIVGRNLADENWIERKPVMHESAKSEINGQWNKSCIGSIAQKCQFLNLSCSHNKLI